MATPENNPTSITVLPSTPPVPSIALDELAAAHQPYIPDSQNIPEFTLSAVLVGAILGILFGASSLYLVLKVGMTVSASVPIAVLSITLFRAFSKAFGIRRATILENNIVQTTGSAGESIAFGVGVTMPALLLLGFEMDVVRVMTVSVLGGLLGILMMIPLRRAFIVKQHGLLKYPEGTACAEVLVAGEKGGATARMVFIGFGIALVHKFLTAAVRLWSDTPSHALFTKNETTGETKGLPGAEIGGELSPELLGVGFLIGPKIACLMVGGAVLSYFVIGPLIATFGDKLTVPVSPATGLISKMDSDGLRANYLRYIGAGAVAAGGIVSMMRAMPLIISSIVSGLRDLRTTSSGQKTDRRTERDMSMSVVLFGSLGLIAALMFIPSLGLGPSVKGFLGALMILVFGFLFVTVSSRLTGEIGSSSNPISGMTIATLLLTCVIFRVAGMVDTASMLTALSVAAVVCIASSNGGTTSQDLKTGFLIGATPRPQQWAILVGALTSALVIGGTMLALDAVGTHYTKTRGVPANLYVTVPEDAPLVHVGLPYEEDHELYYVVHFRQPDVDELKKEGLKPGRYLVESKLESGKGQVRYRTDIPIAREYKIMDNGADAPKGFSAPQPRLFSSIIEGILGGTLEWGLFIIGALIALAVELAGVRALPFAVGMYLPVSASLPIFAGGMLRWAADKLRGGTVSEAESETSPGVLLSSGYIAGGTICGLLVAFLAVFPAANRLIDASPLLGRNMASEEVAKTEAESAKKVAEFEKKAKEAKDDKGRKEAATEAKSEAEQLPDRIEGVRRATWLESDVAKVISLIAFGLLGAFLLWQGLQKAPVEIHNESPAPPSGHSP